jgi:hypothetical protein
MPASMTCFTAASSDLLHCPDGTPRDRLATAGLTALSATHSSAVQQQQQQQQQLQETIHV